MILRCGLPSTTGGFPIRAAHEGYHVLVSAGSMWRKGRFHKAGEAVFRCPSVALDSGGFVAMYLHNGYRWSIEQYVRMAATYPWAWWAQMDFCCEPEIANNEEAVKERINRSAEFLGYCRDMANIVGCKEPIPVLQGWTPDHYQLSAELIAKQQEIPPLVGIGSVCRRDLYGKNGLESVLNALNTRLPVSTKLHLFGVKGAAFELLKQYPHRIHSVDSCAWDFAARQRIIKERRELCKQTGIHMVDATKKLPASVREREREMVSWMEKQTRTLSGSP